MPHSTTFILPAESFPSNMRTTLNGFCAAMGKLGATIGTAVFKPFEDATSLSWTLIACGLVSIMGFFLTYFFVEDARGKDMEEDGCDADLDVERKTASMTTSEGVYTSLPRDDRSPPRTRTGM